MKPFLVAVLLTVTVALGSGDSFGQETRSATLEAQQLRNELRQLKDREAAILIRLQELEYALKPENIERYTSGAGSTRPEELREARRKQLQIERDRLKEQLNEIAQDRPRLEAAILNAESRAYYESAMPNSAPPVQRRMSPLGALLAGSNRKIAAIAVAIMLVGAVVALTRRAFSRGK